VIRTPWTARSISRAEKRAVRDGRNDDEWRLLCVDDVRGDERAQAVAQRSGGQPK
jgi:hypothetical protein